MTPFSRNQPRRKFEGEDFDWPAFRRTLPFQPAVVWFAVSALGRPLANTVPRLTGAVCVGRPRETVASFAYIILEMVLPPLAAAAVYLPSRKRFAGRQLRMLSDAMFSLVMLVSLVALLASARMAMSRWDSIAPGLAPLKALCWP